MTAADLSATAKPWEVHQSTVKIMIEEFYAEVWTNFDTELFRI